MYVHEYSRKDFDTFDECRDDLMENIDSDDIASYSDLTVSEILNAYFRLGNSDDFSAWLSGRIDEAMVYLENDLITEYDDEED